MKRSLSSTLKWFLVGPVIIALTILLAVITNWPPRPAPIYVLEVTALMCAGIVGMATTGYGWFTVLELQDKFLDWMDK